MLTALKIILIAVEVVFLIWFILPAVFHIFKAGNILGVLICAAALFRTAFSTYYHRLGELMSQNGVTRVLWVAVHIACIAFIIFAVVISICMVIAMKIKPADNATAIILGAQVKPWGASRLLKQRIAAAEQYLSCHPDAKAIASGGQGANEPMSEAKCIRETMIKDGIKPERILTEDRSVNTEQNLSYSLSLLKEKNLIGSVATVSDSYHQLRARIIVHKIDRSIRVGACNAVNTKFGFFVYPSYFVREWIAIPVEIVKKLGGPARHHRI